MGKTPTREEVGYRFHVNLDNDGQMHLDVQRRTYRISANTGRILGERLEPWQRDVLAGSVDIFIELQRKITRELAYELDLIREAGVRIDPRTEEVILPERKDKDGDEGS